MDLSSRDPPDRQSPTAPRTRGIERPCFPSGFPRRERRRLRTAYHHGRGRQLPKRRGPDSS